MDSDDHLVICCEDDGKDRAYCDLCDNLCIDRFCKNHLKSRTQTINSRKREQLNKSFQVNSQHKCI